LEALIN